MLKPDGTPDFYQSGIKFAHNLAVPFRHVRHNAGITNAVMEVANEPNIEPPFAGWASYNDFLRGFYYGEREVGFDWPLVCAGLAPNAFTVRRSRRDLALVSRCTR